MPENEYFMQGILDSNERVVTEIYSYFFPKVLGFVLNNKGQTVDAEDIFQKVLIQISARIRCRELQTINSTFEAYLFTACKNLWRRELNLRKRVTNDNIKEQVSEETDMAYALLEQERWELFKEKLEQLSDNCKQVLTLFLNKVSYAEIVEKLSYATETVARQRVFKCKAKLIKIIKSDERFKNLIS